MGVVWWVGGANRLIRGGEEVETGRVVVAELRKLSADVTDEDPVTIGKEGKALDVVEEVEEHEDREEEEEAVEGGM